MKENMKREYKVCGECLTILYAYKCYGDYSECLRCPNIPSCYDYYQPERLSEKTLELKEI